MINLPTGTRLMTLDGTIFGNAIVIGTKEDRYEIETDFGNRLELKTIEEVDSYWSYDLEEEVDLNRWYEERQRLINRNN